MTGGGRRDEKDSCSRNPGRHVHRRNVPFCGGSGRSQAHITVAVLMNKSKWNCLPPKIQKIIDENSGLAPSRWCGDVYDATNGPAKQRVVKSALEVIQLPEADLQKFNAQTILQTERWVKANQAKGLDGQTFLKTAPRYL
jgi:TRAP-type mannitol/chloroaromatic compound transport system substrate-binding protein